MPLIRRRRVLAAKIEETVGTAITLSAADGTINCYNANIEPTIQYLEREGQGSALSPLPGTLAAYSGTATFSVALIGGASAPAWATTLLTACGMKHNAGTFTPESKPPELNGSGAKTITIGSYQDGRYKQLFGCMGNAVFNFVAGQLVMIDFTFFGLWSTPTDVAMIAPTYDTVAPLRFVSSSLAIGSVHPKVSAMTIDLGNQIALRQDPGTSTGLHSAVIVGRRMRGAMTIESSLVGTYDPHGDWLARTERQLSFTLGTPGNQVAFTAPKMQITNVRPGDIDGVDADVLEFQFNRSAAAGDDELSIAIA